MTAIDSGLDRGARELELNAVIARSPKGDVAIQKNGGRPTPPGSPRFARDDGMSCPDSSGLGGYENAGLDVRARRPDVAESAERGDNTMAVYPIFAQENGDRIAINPDHVVSVQEVEPQRVFIALRDGAGVTVALTLESVVARLTGSRDLRSE
jgi:hypothetical protein